MTKTKKTRGDRRHAEIVEWLERTRRRALDEVRKTCYLIFEAPDASPGAHRRAIRFVQFAFERDWFCMDLPTTLSRVEAGRLSWDLPASVPLQATSGAFGQGPRFEQDVRIG